MAKLKKTEEAVEQTQAPEVKDEAVQESRVQDEVNEIPEHVHAILKMYSNYKAIAVDEKGGVFVEGTEHLSNGNAILYQNPYYKQ